MKLRIATRRSQLALTQTRWVIAQLKKHNPGLEVEEVHVVTKGDQVTDRPLYQVGGKGLFVNAVEACVSEGRADIAVHSLKDVPGDVELAEGCDLVCFPKREDPRDVLLTRDGEELMGLRAGAKLGTTSLRRESQLKVHRPDIAFATLRGNVDSRLKKLDDGHYDAIILAAAGLKRLGLLEGRAHQPLSTEVCLPAVGQGTLALEGRIDDEATKAIVACLEDDDTRIVTEAERALLKRLEGSCRVPIAGHGELHDDGNRLSLEGLVGDVDGKTLLRFRSDIYLKGRTKAERVAEAIALGQAVADTLHEKGARELMRQAEAAVARREQLFN